MERSRKIGIMHFDHSRVKNGDRTDSQSFHNIMEFVFQIYLSLHYQTHTIYSKKVILFSTEN